MTSYQLDNAWQRARERLALLEASYDPGTIQQLETLGVTSSWHCLEVGGGGGSIAAWLCQRVGPSGRVVATDIDTRFLDMLTVPNLEVRRHNLLTDAIETNAFDLVHARALLQHLLEREPVLHKLVAALRPGGWLLVEESDLVFLVPDGAVTAAAAALYRKCWAAYDEVFTAGGGDWHYGRRLFRDVCAQPLSELGAAGRVFIVRGGSGHAQFLRLSLEQLSDRVLAAGLLSAAEVSGYLALHDDPDFFWTGETIIAAWGRRPVV